MADYNSTPTPTSFQSPTSQRSEPTVHDPRRAVDKRRLSAGEEDGYVGNLLGRAGAPGWRLGRLRLRLEDGSDVRVVRHLGGVSERGCHTLPPLTGVSIQPGAMLLLQHLSTLSLITPPNSRPDPVPGVLDSRGLGQTNDGVLAGHVRRHAGDGDGAQDACEVDDRAALLALGVGRVAACVSYASGGCLAFLNLPGQRLLLEHLRRLLADAEEHAGDVDAHDAVPLGV